MAIRPLAAPAAVLVAFLGCLVCSGCARPAPNLAPPPPPKVTVGRPVVRRIVEWDAYTGRIDAIESVDVRARVSGHLQSHHFQEGQLVGQGQLLFVLDPRPFEATLAEARAAESEANAKVAQADAMIREAEAKVQEVVSRVELADARLRRARGLVPSGAISQDEFDVLVSESREAEASRFAAEASVESARAGLAAARAAIASAKANVDSAALDLSYTRIEAPISGRISQRLVTEGNFISGGSLGATLLTTIVSLDPIHCYVDADERALLKYTRLDQQGARGSSRDAKNPVYLALSDEKGFPHLGHMDFVDNRLDRATGSIRGRAIFPNPDRTLLPGMFARVRIPGSGPQDAVLIPDAAVGSDQGASFVFVVGDDKKASVRPIVTGPIAHGLRVVRSGLDGSEAIVVSGLQRVRPDSVVDPAPTEIRADESEGLPDDYQPVPREEWLRGPNAPAPGGPTAPASGAAGDPARGEGRP